MNSLKYIIKRIESGETSLSDIRWDKLGKMNFKDAFYLTYHSDFSECNKSEVKTPGGDLIAEFIYNPDTEYNYFATERSTHDGTFLFIGETIKRLVQKLFSCGTYNKNVMKNIPAPEEDPDFYNTHHLKYTFGDVVLGTEFDGDFVPKDKKWMRERTTAMLPIKFEVVGN